MANRAVDRLSKQALRDDGYGLSGGRVTVLVKSTEVMLAVD